jgi:hypothetical protein
MRWKDQAKSGAKNFGKKVEEFGRDVRDSPVGQKVTDVTEGIGKSAREWWKSDKIQNGLKEIEHKFRDVRDDLVKSLKPLPKDQQEEALKKFDDYKLNSDESLKQAENEGDFNSKSESILSDLLKITSNLRGAVETVSEVDNLANSDDGLDVVLPGSSAVDPNDNDII